MAGNRWIRLDVDYFSNPKTLTAGRDGRDMHMASICWVGRFLTDGHIPAEVVDSIAADAGVMTRNRATAVDRTVASGLWIPNGDGFYLHHYVEMNGSRADVEKEREQYRQRQRRYNSNRRKNDDANDD